MATCEMCVCSVCRVSVELELDHSIKLVAQLGDHLMLLSLRRYPSLRQVGVGPHRSMIRLSGNITPWT
jgi:hypothetical protein